MSTDAIFLRRAGGELLRLSPAPYDSEAILQKLLAEHSDLLTGAQTNPGTERRWLLVRREMGVPDHPEGGSRWSIDHLFLDREAVPTLVEVKRASDNRLRREVVGQMLDYAANGLRYWPTDALRDELEHTSGGPDALRRDLAELLGQDADDLDVDGYFQQVAANLSSGRVRLVFVADDIPSELQRVVEFLNDQLRLAEVLAIEVRQYLADGEQVLVPRLVGATPAAAAAKGRTSPPWRSLEELFSDVTGQVSELRDRLAAWSTTQHDIQVSSTGTGMRPAAGRRSVAVLHPGGSGHLEFSLAQLRARGRNADADQLLERLRALAPGSTLTPAQPNVPVDVLLRRWDEASAILGDLAAAVRTLEA